MDKVSLRLELLKISYRKDLTTEMNLTILKDLETHVLREEKPEETAPKKGGGKTKNGNPDILS